MRSDVLMRRVLLTATLVVVFATGLTIGQNKYGQPKSVIHLVTLKWKATSTPAQQQAAIADLRRMYPGAPVGLPQGAENEYSTYGHLVTCYLEILAARELLGGDRASAAIANKGNYTWIYATVLRDEKKIATVVDRHGLRLK